MSAADFAAGAALVLAAACGTAWAAGDSRARPTSSRPTGWRSACSRPSWLVTLCITKWAAAKTKSAADFYTAGGGITGFQNGLAIAGDYMSAASFLGISAAV